MMPLPWWLRAIDGRWRKFLSTETNPSTRTDPFNVPPGQLGLIPQYATPDRAVAPVPTAVVSDP